MESLPAPNRFALGIWLAVFVAVCVMAFAWDVRIAKDLPVLSKQDKKLVGKISHYGDWPFLAGAGTAGLVVATMLRRPGARRVLLSMILASTLAGIATNAVRGTSGRARPEAARHGIAPGWYGLRHNGEWLVGKNRYNSFPSGHTATAVGFFGVLLFVGRWQTFLAGFVLCVPVPLSRLLLNQHWFSDVVVASGIALIAAWWTYRRWSPTLDAWWMQTLGYRLASSSAPPWNPSPRAKT